MELPLLRAYLEKNKDTPISVESLSDHFDTGVSNIKAALEELRSDGLNLLLLDDHIALSKQIAKEDPLVIDISGMSDGNVYRFGVCGDTHLGSKYERLDALKAFYLLLEKEGISTVYHTGNHIEGEAPFNQYDIHTRGCDAQIDYFVKKYPKIDGLTTYFITGDDHEGWYTQKLGINTGKYTDMKAKNAGRNDLIWLGHMEHDIHVKAKKGKTIIRLVHPGGGTAYAISYTMQKLIESYAGGEKPHVVLAGHYHKAEYIFLRNVHTIQTACFQDQTPFMRKKRIPAHVGGWIVEFTQANDGSILRFKSEFVPFFDNGIYQKGKQWKYNW